MYTLYLVATPIGNLEDISLRALRILREASLIAAEDTRTTGKLLKHFEITTPLKSFHEHSDKRRIGQLLDLLHSGDVAVVSDAGMPGLSDPGYELVVAAVEAGIKVVPIPGASAAVAALVSSGLPTDKHLFMGFLPSRRAARLAALREVAQLPYTLVMFESPYRLLALLEDVLEVMGDRRICVGRELTKLHEEIWRGSLRPAIDYFGSRPIKGEITVVLAGAERTAERWNENEIRATLQVQLDNGLSLKAASEAISRVSGWRPREIYSLGLSTRR